MQKSKEYWAKRALKREQESFARGAKLTAKLFQEYQTAAKAIRKAVNDYYVKYAAKHGLTYEDAIKLLNRRESQEWKADLEEYIAQIAAETDPEVKARLTAHLDALSYNSSITRLDALQGQIDMILNNLYSEGVAQMREEFGAELLESYYHKVYDLQSRAGFIGEFARFDARMIENVVSYPWSGAVFSVRLWQNTQALAFHAREIMTQGVIQGKSIAAMSKELSNKMGQSYKAAERLVRTEQNHIHNEADTKAYEAAGVEEYEYMATLDARTCEVCGALDGQHFPLSKRQVGVNYPPMHPNDRCTTVEYDPDDAMDWYNSGVPMPKDMTYQEWYEQQVKQKKGGLAADGNNSEPQKSVPQYTGRIDVSDPNLVESKLREFEAEVLKEPIEHAYVILENGKTYRFTGSEDRVHPETLGKALKGAYINHNHPILESAFSFSNDDFEFFKDFNLKELYGFDERYSYVLSRNKPPVKAEPFSLGNMRYENYQHSIISEMAEKEGFYYERKERTDPDGKGDQNDN
jgi:SPP1 gp7 family putative phage head morphogenesis protein